MLHAFGVWCRRAWRLRQRSSSAPLQRCAWLLRRGVVLGGVCLALVVLRPGRWAPALPGAVLLRPGCWAPALPGAVVLRLGRWALALPGAALLGWPARRVEARR